MTANSGDGSLALERFLPTLPYPPTVATCQNSRRMTGRLG